MLLSLCHDVTAVILLLTYVMGANSGCIGCQYPPER